MITQFTTVAKVIPNAADAIAKFNGVLKTGSLNWNTIASVIGTSDKNMISYLKTVDGGEKTIEGYSAHVKGLGSSFKIAAVGATLLNVAMNVALMLAVSLAIKGISWAIDQFVNYSKNLKAKVKELAAEYEELKEQQTSLESEQVTVKKNLEDLYILRENGTITQAEKDQLDNLEKTNLKLATQLEYLKNIATLKGQEAETVAVKSLNSLSEPAVSQFMLPVTSAKRIKENMELISDYETQILSLVASSEDYEEESARLTKKQSDLLNENNALIITMEELNGNIISTTGKNSDLKKSNEALILSAQELANSVMADSSAIKDASDATGGAADTVKTFKEIMDSITGSDKVKALSTAWKELESGQAVSTESMVALLDLYPDLISYVDSETGAITLSKEAIQEKYDLEKQAHIDILNNTREELKARLNSVESINSMNAKLASGTLDSTQTTLLKNTVKNQTDVRDQIDVLDKQIALLENLSMSTATEDLKTQQEAIDKNIASLEKQYSVHQNEKKIIRELTTLRQKYNSVLSDAQKLDIQSKIQQYTVAGFNNNITDLEHQITLIKQRNYTTAEILPIYAKMQVELKNLAEYYKSIGYDNNSTEIQGVQQQQIKITEEASGAVTDYVAKLETAYKAHQNEKQIISELNGVLSQYNNILSETDKSSIQSKIQEYTVAGFNNNITDLEHQLKLIQQRTDSESKMIPIYRQEQDEVQKLIEYYKSLGYDDNSSEIQAAQSQLIDLNKSVSEAEASMLEKTRAAIDKNIASLEKQYSVHQNEKQIVSELTDVLQTYNDTLSEEQKLDLQSKIQEHTVSGYKDAVNDLEHQISLIGDRNDAESKSIPIYKQEQAEVQKLISYYKSLGYDGNSTEIQDLENQYNSLANTIEDAYTKIHDSKISNIEFDISELARTEGTENARVALYRKAQAEILVQQKYYLSLGYDATSSQLQDLKKQYYSYSDEINNITKETFTAAVDAQKAALESEISSLQGKIDATKTVLDAIVESIKREKQGEIDVTQKALDAENKSYDAEKSIIESHYGDLKSAAQSAIDSLNAKYDNSKTKIEEYYSGLTDATNAALDNEKKRYDESAKSIDEYYSSLIDESKTALDVEKNRYDEATKAIEEYYGRSETVNSGVIDLARESLAAEKEKYDESTKAMEEYYDGLIDESNVALDAENERYRTSVDAIEEYYGRSETVYTGVIDLIRESIDAENERYNESTKSMEKYYSDLIDESNAALAAENERYNANKDAIEEYYGRSESVSKGIIDVVRSELDAENDKFNESTKAIEEYYDGLTDIAIESYDKQKETMTQYYDDLIKTAEDASKAQIDSINEEKDAYQKLIDAKIESLQADKDADDYNRSIEEKNRNISSIQQELDAIQFDPTATTKRLELQSKLADANTDLTDYQTDYGTDKQIESLKSESDAYSEMADSKVALLESENAIELAILSKQKTEYLSNIEAENKAELALYEQKRTQELAFAEEENANRVTGFENTISLLEAEKAAKLKAFEDENAIKVAAYENTISLLEAEKTARLKASEDENATRIALYENRITLLEAEKAAKLKVAEDENAIRVAQFNLNISLLEAEKAAKLKVAEDENAARIAQFNLNISLLEAEKAAKLKVAEDENAIKVAVYENTITLLELEKAAKLKAAEEENVIQVVLYENRIKLLEREKEARLKASEQENARRVIEYENRIKLLDIYQARELQNAENLNSSQVSRYESEIAALQNYLSQEGTIRDDANKLFESMSTDVWKNIMAYEAKYNSDVASLQSAWNIATQGMNNYNNSQLAGVRNLGAMLTMLTIYSSKLAVLNNTSLAGQKTVPKFHTGGAVGKISTKKQDETLAILQNPEIVATEKMQDTIINLADFAKSSKMLLSNLSATQNPLATGADNAYKNAVNQVTSNANNNSNIRIDKLFDFNAGSVTSESVPLLEKTLKQVSDYVIGKLESTYTRKGNNKFLNKSV